MSETAFEPLNQDTRNPAHGITVQDPSGEGTRSRRASSGSAFTSSALLRRSEQRQRCINLALGALTFLSLCVCIAVLALQRGKSSPALGPAPAPVRACANSNLLVVRDVKTLTAEEKSNIVRGIHAMKKLTSQYDSSMNAWDYFVSTHRAATLPDTQVHAGWYFYPWHRELMRRLNVELQRATGISDITFPYWNWADDASSAALWDLDYLGPRTGLEQDGYVIKEGNFKEGDWVIHSTLASLPGEQETSGIMRASGNGLQMCLDPDGGSWVLDTPFNHRGVDRRELAGPFTFLPPSGPPNFANASLNVFLKPRASNLRCRWEDLTCDRYYDALPSQRVDAAESGILAGKSIRCRHFAASHPVKADYERCNPLAYTTSDSGKLGQESTNPWATTKDYYNSPAQYFRACFEGIDPSVVIAKGLERLGASLHPPHGATHTWSGGSLATPTSPNDPIFTHLHWNVDRMFAEWQKTNGNGWFLNGPRADRLDADLPLFNGVKLRDVLDHRALGFTFDTIC